MHAVRIRVAAAYDPGMSEVDRDALAAGLVAAVISGVPSTAWAVARRHDVLAAARAAGTLVLPSGAAAGLAIAALDLGVIGRRIAAIRALEQLPQWLDHVAYGEAVGAVLRARRRARCA